MKLSSGPLLIGLLGYFGNAHAVPTLQVGAPASGGTCIAGPYEPSLASSTNPKETDTAITSGSVLCAAAIYGKGDLLVGGMFDGDGTYPKGSDWSGVKLDSKSYFPTAFDGHGAILVATVPEGALGTVVLTVDGKTAFLSNELKSYFPNDHDPVKSDIGDFLFFDIGDFPMGMNVPNFAPESGKTDTGTGGIIGLNISVSGVDWVHFDLLALVTTGDCQKDNSSNKLKTAKVATLSASECQTYVVSTDDSNNPGSHDVTWKKPTTPEPPVPPTGVPEPTSLALLGIGLLGAGLAKRRRRC